MSSHALCVEEADGDAGKEKMKAIKMIDFGFSGKYVSSLHLLYAQTATVGSFNGYIVSQVQNGRQDSIVRSRRSRRDCNWCRRISAHREHSGRSCRIPGAVARTVPVSAAGFEPAVYAIAEGQILVDGTAAFRRL